MGGANESEGTVEIFHNKTWGTICDNPSWTLIDATVVCRQLGFPGAIDAPRGAYFGQGGKLAPIWLGGVECEGSEVKIEQCPQGSVGQHDCARGHSEDAGVICEGECDM